MDSAELLRHRPLRVSPEQAAAVLGTLYGLEGVVTALAGERDNNFRIETGDRSLNLKIANPVESASALEMQQLALLHVRAQEPAIPIPQPVATRHGDLVGAAKVGDVEVKVRATTFLAGSNVDSVGYSAALRTDVIRQLAKLDCVLATFSHPELSRPLLWDLGRVLELRAHTAHLPPEQEQIAIGWLAHFESDVKPQLDVLPRQAVHGDFNAANLIVDPMNPDRLAGIVDFGDMNLAPRVVDLAVAAAYQCLEAPDPAETLAAAAAAYHAVEPLSPAETVLVNDLVVTRLVQSLVISAWRAALHPDNRDYILIHAAPVWRTLQRLVGSDPSDLRNVGASAAEATPAVEPLAELIQRRRTHMGPGMRLSYEEPLHIVSGRGVWLTDANGVRYLDAYNNVAHVGHGHPEVTKALSAQADKLNTNTRYLVADVIDYAERLAGMFPDPLKVVYFANSGSEANDLAWRMARSVTGRRGMIITTNAYHGSTYLTMATSPEELSDDRLETWVATVRPDLPASQAGKAVEGAIAQLAKTGESPAAFVCDTIFSSDGILEPPRGFLATVYEATRAAGGLCIADEIQAGFGRVGRRMWGFAGHGVLPDIVTLGKPMGNGHPLAAVVTTAEIADQFSGKDYYFSTFAGNPVSAAVGSAVLDVMERERLPQQAERVGTYLRQRLETLASQHAVIADVRGPGLFIGVEIDRDGPDSAAAERIQNEMRYRGVLIGRTGPHGNVLKIRPPLVFAEAHAAQLLATLEGALAEG